MIQRGDFVMGDGTGCVSIYGDKFKDENFQLRHNESGLLQMANSDPNSNGCQFFITCTKCDWLDGKYVVFGEVIDTGLMQVIRIIETTSKINLNKQSQQKRVENYDLNILMISKEYFNLYIIGKFILNLYYAY